MLDGGTLNEARINYGQANHSKGYKICLESPGNKLFKPSGRKECYL